MPSLENNDTEVTQGTRRDLTGTTILDTATNSTLYYHDGSSIAQVLSKGTRIDKGSVDGEGVGNSCWHITTKVSEVDAETFRSKQLKIFRTIQLGTEAEAPQGELEEVCLWADNALET